MLLENDYTVPPMLQRIFIELLGGYRANDGDTVTVYGYAVDHCVNVANPLAMVECILKTAGEMKVDSKGLDGSMKTLSIPEEL
jgi:hypothetical protein